MNRPFLKWPGGKYRLIERITAVLPEGNKLIEPFVGSGAVFLNTSYKHYVLNDANRDLITLYQLLQQKGEAFINFAKTFFTKKNNSEKRYYILREKFNKAKDPIERSALFLYLNRHGYNGLCRYNTKKGEFNVPFGRYLNPYFPEKELYFFYKKSKQAIFVCEDFSATLRRAAKGVVVYCDPPYVPLSATAQFTSYRAGGFSLSEHNKLLIEVKGLVKKGISVLISNHSTEFTRNLYADARLNEFSVQRFISCKPKSRQAVLELLALFKP